MNESPHRLYITRKWVITIFIYYFLLFITGSIGSVCVLLSHGEGLPIFERALLGSIAIAVAAAASSYIRKLYKLCFQYSSEQDNDDQLFLKQLGTVVYFITRPLFAILFAILVVTGLRSGLMLSAPGSTLDEGFVFLSMVPSFYVGFLSGDFIKQLEAKGLKKLDKIVS